MPAVMAPVLNLVAYVLAGLGGGMLALRSGIPAAALAGALLGAGLELAFVRHMARKNASEDSFLLLTIGLALTLSAGTLFFVGRDGYLLPPFGEGVLIVLDAVIQFHAL